MSPLGWTAGEGAIAGSGLCNVDGTGADGIGPRVPEPGGVHPAITNTSIGKAFDGLMPAHAPP